MVRPPLSGRGAARFKNSSLFTQVAGTPPPVVSRVTRAFVPADREKIATATAIGTTITFAILNQIGYGSMEMLMRRAASSSSPTMAEE